MSGERYILVPSADYALFQTLKEQVGELESPILFEAEDADCWYNPDLASSEMAVRGIVRVAILERLGYQPEKHWVTDEGNIAHLLDDNPEVKVILGTPSFSCYDWQYVSSRNLGSFADLQQKAGSSPMVDAEKGLVFFADEVQKLAEGQVVITLHSAGLGSGYIAETKEAFGVVSGNLQRIHGLLTD